MTPPKKRRVRIRLPHGTIYPTSEGPLVLFEDAYKRIGGRSFRLGWPRKPHGARYNRQFQIASDEMRLAMRLAVESATNVPVKSERKLGTAVNRLSKYVGYRGDASLPSAFRDAYRFFTESSASNETLDRFVLAHSHGYARAITEKVLEAGRNMRRRTRA